MDASFPKSSADILKILKYNIAMSIHDIVIKYAYKDLYCQYIINKLKEI
jgi:hypothetical protein